MPSPPPISLHTLGAGRDVGRSCFLLTIGATRVLLDTGLHPARRHPAERYPAFTAIPSPSTIDVVLLSHAHLDHAGALPLLTEVFGHPGPVYASAATRDLLPPLFDDLLAGGGGGGDGAPVLPPYTAAQAAASVAKVVATPPPGTPWSPAPGVVVVASLAGHTLGALSFAITAHGRRVVYAGDLSVDEGPRSPLPPAVLDRTAPRADLLILEATAAGTWARPPRAMRAAGLVAAMTAAVGGGGKVLLAVPAVGRYQEVLLLLDVAAREGGGLAGVPILGGSSLGWRVNTIYRRHAEVYGSPYAAAGGGGGEAAASPPPAGGHAVTGASLPSPPPPSSPSPLPPSPLRSPWAFSHITAYRRAEHWAPLIAAPGVPVVVVAAPSSMTGGLSREVLVAVAGDSRNLVVAPAFAIANALTSLALEGRSIDSGGRRGGDGVAGGGRNLVADAPRPLAGAPADVSPAALLTAPSDATTAAAAATTTASGVPDDALVAAAAALPATAPTVGHGSIPNGNVSCLPPSSRPPTALRCRVMHMPFSAHADERGLVRAVRAARPTAVAVVHGEPGRVDGFAARLRTRFAGLTVVTPVNGSVVVVPTGREAGKEGGNG